MDQQQKLHRRDLQLPFASREGTAGITSVDATIEDTGGHSEKRKRRVLECDSEEDDFAGFDEDDAAGSENGVLSPPRPSSSSVISKKVKEFEAHLSKTGTFQPKNSTAEEGVAVNDQVEMESLVGFAPAVVSGVFDNSSKTIAANQVKRKVAAVVNAQDEAFRVPFKYGWKRELVYRANLDGNSKDKGEVYYITPSGKKLRTRNDIVMALHDGLTMDNFTFVKDPVGGSPDEEIIRSAKTYGSTPRRSITSASVLDIPTENNLGKRIPKPKMPKGSSPTPPSSYARSSMSSARTPPSSRSNSQTSPKSGATMTAARGPALVAAGTKPNENTFGAAKSVKAKSKSDETRKMLGNTKTTSQNSRNFIAADLAAIRSDSDTLVSRSSSLAAGAEQNRLFASNFFSNVSIGYDVLQQTFQYLKVQELLRASCVCRMWNQVANHPRLWRTVRMKNSHVNDWTGLVDTLRKNGTKHLDLRKMLISGNSDEMWQSFMENISHVEHLERIDLCRCSSVVVGNLLKSNPSLKVINALAIKNDPMDFSYFEHGKFLQELRLKSSAAVSVESDFSQLGFLTTLRHLSLTSILKLGSTSIIALSNLVNLESLELGECTEIGVNLADVLPKLFKLQRLRLEKGQENFNMFAVLEGIAKAPSLTQLELINCDVKVGFDKHINKCSNIRKLLLIPTYISQSAATNHMVLSGVAKLRDTLKLFIWTVTVELLRVTELYIDQCDTKNRDEKNSPGESIPILKPVPGVDEVPTANSSNTSDAPAQVEIVPLTTVNKILDRSLPRTKLKILKIPFASTWKQGMIEIC
ncbi:F-box/LRR-repeat protein 7 isoform X2 [Sabethes cyaneus]|uniref:F-box/LRR-repeat protein 7 isoform X2 n=1 Tax=Sabethes cyaneus TaxID=53552 RepID=UPI00237D3AF6|nr:F-box/LRR-repeat protein 7 isoform X2 [Sabethes cyaneus]